MGDVLPYYFAGHQSTLDHLQDTILALLLSVFKKGLKIKAVGCSTQGGYLRLFLS